MVLSIVLLACVQATYAQSTPSGLRIIKSTNGITAVGNTGNIEVEMLAPDLLRVAIHPGGKILA